MKKTLIALLSLALILTLCCGAALAATGDLTIRDTKAYTDAEMTQYAGTIPACTSLLVRSHEDYADVYLNGKTYYVSNFDLLNADITSNYSATLKKGVTVYQRPTSSSRSVTLKKEYKVNICMVSENWALVQSTNSLSAYAFVKLDKLSDIKTK